MKKSIFILTVFLLFTNCSHLIDVIWNTDTASFEAVATWDGVNVPRISFTKSDHLSVRKSGMVDSDSYFKAYYIYRSEDPYDGYRLIGMEALAYLLGTDGTGQTIFNEYREKKGLAPSVTESQGGANDTSSRYYVDSVTCSPKKMFFYRVVSVYLDWNKTDKVWKNTTSDEDKSGIAAIQCP